MEEMSQVEAKLVAQSEQEKIQHDSKIKENSIKYEKARKRLENALERIQVLERQE